jgi:hypothetical protein
MSPALAVMVAVAFVWLGMVLAISFLEAPLKFRAPDVTLTAAEVASPHRPAGFFYYPPTRLPAAERRSR